MRKTRNRRRSRRRRSRKMRGGMFGLGEGLKKVGSFFGIGNREDNKGEDLRPKSPVSETPPMEQPQQEPVKMVEPVSNENQVGGKKRRRRRKSKKRGGGCGCAAPMTGGKRKRRRRRTHKKKRKSRRRRR